MTELEIRNDMDIAAKEDRERFFVVADTLHLQPKYKSYVDSGELEAVKQYWRDMTLQVDYPNIDFPIQLPEWFPRVRFASSWKKDSYIEQELKMTAERERAKKEQTECVCKN